MDCDRFDDIVLDALGGELSELELAAVRRHADGCARCRTAWSELQATLEVAEVPLEEPPAGMAERVLAAAAEARARAPARHRAGFVSWAASYAMRPQMAMAALLLLMIGSSLLFLRGRERSSAPGARVSVTEQGEPAAEAPFVDLPAARVAPTEGPQRTRAAAEEERARGAREVAQQPSAAPARDEGLAAASKAQPFAAPPPASAAPDDEAQADRRADPWAAASELARAGRHGEAAGAFDAIAAGGGRQASNAAMQAARMAQASSGCAAAAPRYERVATDYPGSVVADDARWAAAQCWQSLGRAERARELYVALRSAAGYHDRAEAQLAALDAPRAGAGAGVGGVAGRASPAAAAPAAKPASPPASAADAPP